MVDGIEEMAEKLHQGHNVRVTKSKTGATAKQTTISIVEIKVGLTAKDTLEDDNGHHTPLNRCMGPAQTVLCFEKFVPGDIGGRLNLLHNFPVGDGS